MTSRYISHQTDPVRELTERIGAQIESVRRPNKATVVPLRKDR